MASFAAGRPPVMARGTPRIGESLWAELTMAGVRDAAIFVRGRGCFKGRTMTFADAE
jgi:hypothetical protein